MSRRSALLGAVEDFVERLPEDAIYLLVVVAPHDHGADTLHSWGGGENFEAFSDLLLEGAQQAIEGVSL